MAGAFQDQGLPQLGNEVAKVGGQLFAAREVIDGVAVTDDVDGRDRDQGALPGRR